MKVTKIKLSALDPLMQEVKNWLKDEDMQGKTVRVTYTSDGNENQLNVEVLDSDQQ